MAGLPRRRMAGILHRIHGFKTSRLILRRSLVDLLLVVSLLGISLLGISLLGVSLLGVSLLGVSLLGISIFTGHLHVLLWWHSH